MKENHTHITAVLDRSGSMRSLQGKTIEGFNGFVTEQQRVPGTATLSLFLFDDICDVVHSMVDIQKVPELTENVYYARGWTALYDALAKAVDSTGQTLAALPEEERPSKVTVLVMTDGEENSSTEFGGEKGRLALKAKIEHQTQKYNWEFVFMGANIDAKAVGTSLGIAAGNSAQYVASASGTEAVYTSMSRGVARSRTLGKQVSFFDDNDPKDQT
jgi:hypothetical protein